MSNKCDNFLLAGGADWTEWAKYCQINTQMHRLKVKRYSSPEQVISELGGVTCQMESTTLLATWHKRTHIAITPARQASIQFPYSIQMDCMGDWLHTNQFGLPVHRTIQEITW